MGVSQSLTLATDAPVREVAAAVAEIGTRSGLFAVSPTPEAVLETTVTVRGTWVQVYAPSPVPRPCDVLLDEFDVESKVKVSFGPDKAGSFPEQHDDIMTVVAGLLKRFEGNAVLLYFYEIVWLARRDGELVLNERDDLWPPQRLAAVTLPYRRAAIADL